MPRELVVDLIKRKKAIHQANHVLVIEELSVEEELAYCYAPEKEAELNVKLGDIKTKKLAVEAQLGRAYEFSGRHTSGPIPTLCPTCFVDHNESSLMVESAERHWTGERLFKCEKCGTEFHLAEIVDR